MSEAKVIAKWGFGMAPISSRMRKRYDDAVQTILDLIAGNLTPNEVNPDHISELKGMFNRCLRQDQWDWFSVYTDLGEPDRKMMQRVVNVLIRLRQSIIASDSDIIKQCNEDLIRSSLLTYLSYYQDDSLNQYPGGSECGWIYVLSTRDQPDILKIGMTRRSVEQRVKEINSATGVLIPFSARKVFRVSNAATAERAVFADLSSCRVRQDREFFRVSYKEAVAAIEKTLERLRLYQRKNGVISWFSQEQKYGFVTVEKGEDVFIHVSQVQTDHVVSLVPGAVVEFDIGFSPRGPFALNVKTAGNAPASV